MFHFLSFGLYIIATIMDMNPRKQIVGASLMRRKLNISGSKCVSVEPGPIISKKPKIIAATPAASSM